MSFKPRLGMAYSFIMSGVLAAGLLMASPVFAHDPLMAPWITYDRTEPAQCKSPKIEQTGDTIPGMGTAPPDAIRDLGFARHDMLKVKSVEEARAQVPFRVRVPPAGLAGPLKGIWVTQQQIPCDRTVVFIYGEDSSNIGNYEDPSEIVISTSYTPNIMPQLLLQTLDGIGYRRGTSEPVLEEGVASPSAESGLYGYSALAPGIVDWWNLGSTYSIHLSPTGGVWPWPSASGSEKLLSIAWSLQ